MTTQNQTRRAGDATEFGDAVCLAANGPKNNPGLFPPQAKNTVINAAHQFHRARAKRHQVLTVQIGVRTATQPHGRAGPFRIPEDDLQQLIDHAARLERRS